MQKEMISRNQAIALLVMFVFGSSVVMGVSSEAEQDSWLALLLAAVFIMPVILIYARIIRLFPEKDLFEIAEALFGKIVGKVITLLMTWYALHLGALVLRNFSEFIQIQVLTETPQLPIMLAMMLVVFYITISGIETMGKWTIAMLSVVLLIVLLTIALSVNDMEFTNILPMFAHSFGSIAKSSFQIFSFPYAETVLFLCIASSVKKADSPYKLYVIAVLIGTVILLSIILRNTLLLGTEMVKRVYFPSYTAARVIHLGDFLSRIEGSIAINFILAGIIKIAVCLLAAAKGTAKLFGIKNYRDILLPMSLLIVALCAILYKNVMEMFDFVKIYQYYAFPFQVLIPLAVWILAEIKMHGKKAPQKA